MNINICNYLESKSMFTYIHISIGTCVCMYTLVEILSYVHMLFFIPKMSTQVMWILWHYGFLFCFVYFL